LSAKGRQTDNDKDPALPVHGGTPNGQMTEILPCRSAVASVGIKAFNRFKSERDGFFHSPGPSVPQVEGIRSMMSRYLRLHLDLVGARPK
jgi:hypothetical protein